jgi:hypothetical protein
MDLQPCKSLESCLPDGQVVDRAWLKQRGFDRPRVDFFVRSGALQAVARGAYRRPGPALKWEHLVYSLQELGYPVHVGGRSALEAQGMAHYLPVGGMRTISLYGMGRWPGWLEQIAVDYLLERHNPRLFAELPEVALTSRPFGHWDWPIRFATPELAFLELFAEIQTTTDFEVADKLFEAAATLRPERVRTVLLACTQIKAKRLFLWFGARHRHPWYPVLESTGVDLGSGKRMIIKGGVLNRDFQITVPRNMETTDDSGTDYF